MSSNNLEKKSNQPKKQEDNSNEIAYVYQSFGPKALALINKYNLQSDESYKKLISSYEKIDSLTLDDPRRDNLTELWESEFNRIFKFFWEGYVNTNKKSSSNSGSKIDGWKDRLDVKAVSMSPSQKRQDLLNRLSGGNKSVNRNTREDILSRAGYQSQTKVEQFNFTATPKTGRNLHEIENILNDLDTSVSGSLEPESFLKSGYLADKNSDLIDNVNIEDDLNDFEFDEETKIMTTKAVQDPNLEAFVNDTNYSTSNNLNDSIKNEEDSFDNESNDQDYIANENMSRAEFNAVNNIEYDENAVTSNDDTVAALELGLDFFQRNIGDGFYDKQKLSNKQDDFKPFKYNVKDELINPLKKNILSKEGFEISKNDLKSEMFTDKKYNQDNEVSSEIKKPYHEIKPVGNYQMKFDVLKRPSMRELLEENSRENKTIDEMTQKIEFLRELRNERRHRINLLKIERTNSYIVARSRKIAESRELRRIKKREEINLKAIQKAERLRRLQERQRLIELMKERQMKRTEEKRIATVLRLERERRLERDAKNRAELASIDAQIRYEQEMIKKTELKMKAYFTRVHDDELFDESIKAARKTDKYKSIEEKALEIQQLEDKKRKERIEKISKKFTKNIK
ncbi:hypothetical protein [Spiroplasma turonicum]|uniref:Uncharacterized protein n=1 Tax=Spiroplasma turonicum TaxID=216946 RepID=A0A0K1P5M6_9MOLU|nr:hypothetical protein [Spiroplasma turonicum]AKU79550.1 hypothetical protein STURON_00304 [Spiroplasma turonicum]ALX70573.1 hypothetical protein STURO_v1c03050 [Spiroplasma turonicum]